jgi:hypothetical protein
MGINKPPEFDYDATKVLSLLPSHLINIPHLFIPTTQNDINHQLATQRQRQISAGMNNNSATRKSFTTSLGFHSIPTLAIFSHPFQTPMHRAAFHDEQIK